MVIKRANINRRGFSRIDTLVVILAMACFVAVVLPSLGNAKGVSEKTRCLQNLRQLILASCMYAADYEYLPFTRNYRTTDDGFMNYTILDDTGDGDYMDVEDFLNHGMLFGYGYLENSWAYYCPTTARDLRYARDTYFDEDGLRSANERAEILENLGRYRMSRPASHRVRSSYICRNYCPEVSTEPYKDSRGGRVDWGAWKEEAGSKMLHSGNYAFLADRWTYSSGPGHENNKIYNVAYSDGRVDSVVDPKGWIHAFGSRPIVIPPDSNFRSGSWMIGWYLLDNNFDWYNATAEDCSKLPSF